MNLTKLGYILLLCGIVLLACGFVFGDCPTPSRVVRTYSAPTYYSAPYVPPVKVIKKVVIEEVPVVVRFEAVIPLVSLPSYSAQFVPPPPAASQLQQLGPQPVPQQQGGDMARVMSLLDTISKRLDVIEARQRGDGTSTQQKGQQQPPQPQKDDKVSTAAQIIETKCASCHKQEVAAEKGGSLVLSAGGKLAELSGRQANKVIGRSYAGTMPPKDSGVPALTDQEVSVIVQQFTSNK